MKKHLLSLLFIATILIFPASAAGLFPVDSVSADGYRSWGYMDEDGALSIPFQYAEATAFNDKGLALVTDQNGNIAVIDEQGNPVVPYQPAPVSAAFGDKAIAFRYDTETRYFDLTGKELGVFSGASGFFSKEGLLPVQRDGVWGYANSKQELVIPCQYHKAGAFSGGYALVQLADGSYAVIDVTGAQTPLPADSAPAYDEVYGGDIVVLTNQSRFALYSVKVGAPLTDYIYQSLSAFDNGYAAARMNNLWGVINLRGNASTMFQYNYLSYMGDGVYTARGADGSVSAIDANGNLIYRTLVYAGGFSTVSHGISWHGTMENGIIFFSKVGGYVTQLNNAENPSILTNDVALVTIGGKQQYIRLHDGKMLYSPAREYDMEHFQVSTTSYEKYLGMRRDGTEYGWALTYPVISGLADKTVQAKINTAIETFFLEGPSLPAQKQPLTGSYGLRVKGRLLVVWADCVSGSGDGAAPWNDNITLDLATGARYQIARDLLTGDAPSVLKQLLPSQIPYYLFSYPRITDSGISVYLNHTQKGNTAASVETYDFTFAQLRQAIDETSECWSALNGTAIGALENYSGYSDVPLSYWAYDAIRAATESELMLGSGGKFQPEKPITAAEAASILVRALDIDTSRIAAPSGAPWYYVEVTAAGQSGLLRGLPTSLNYTAALTRADAMEMLSGALLHKGEKALSDQETSAVLAPFTDAQDVPQARRAATARCIKSGLIVGTNNKLSPSGEFTRAQFAQILSRLSAK